jgi:hypothetical protein
VTEIFEVAQILQLRKATTSGGYIFFLSSGRRDVPIKKNEHQSLEIVEIFDIF